MNLTTAEYNVLADRLLKNFALAAKDGMLRHVWKTAGRGVTKTEQRLLWLFVFALNTWDHDDEAINFLTEEQVISIFQKSNAILR